MALFFAERLCLVELATEAVTTQHLLLRHQSISNRIFLDFPLQHHFLLHNFCSLLLRPLSRRTLIQPNDYLQFQRPVLRFPDDFSQGDVPNLDEVFFV